MGLPTKGFSLFSDCVLLLCVLLETERDAVFGKALGAVTIAVAVSVGCCCWLTGEADVGITI